MVRAGDPEATSAKGSFRLDKSPRSLHELMVRLSWLVTVLLLAFGAIVAAADSDREATSGAARFTRTADAFERADDRHSAQAPLPPIDVNDGDDEESFAPQFHVVPWQSAALGRVSPCGESIRPSLGHPPGIDDPPRS